MVRIAVAAASALALVSTMVSTAAGHGEFGICK
jgi:hypothetical protein